jgi:hypothetical protein
VNKFPWMYWILFCAAWSVLGLDLLHGERTMAGNVAGIWLLAQTIGLGLQKLHIGISEKRFWNFWADAKDGGINSAQRRNWVWFWFEVLSHFSLLQHDTGAPAKMAKHRDSEL